MSQSSPQQDFLETFAFVIPFEKFVYQVDGAWNLEQPVGKEGIRNYLLEMGVEPEDIDTTFKNYHYLRVFGADLAPNKDPIFRTADGRAILNTWVKPKLQPVAGEYPRLQRVLNWLTRGDAEGMRWLKHWMAWKVQIPDLVPKVAVVLGTQQGGGKGTLAYVMRQMLGEANTAVVKREELGNRFNSRWVGKLFVLGDEVLSNENVKDISNMLKVLIDGSEIELEGKGTNQRAINNRLAWMFASNDTVAPLVLERGDRRYSVFSNHDPLPADYRDSLNTSFQADRKTPTDEFAAEMAAFYHELLNTKVDYEFVSRPFDNGDREALIEANLPAHTLFIRHVNECGIDDLLDQLKRKDFHLDATSKDWDFGEEGVSSQVVYRCYQHYCQQIGAKSLRMNKLTNAVTNNRPAWEATRKYVAHLNSKIGVYIVPRRKVADKAAA